MSVIRSLTVWATLWMATRLVAQDYVLRVEAPDHADRPLLVYRCMDLFTQRMERVATAILDAQGTARVTGTALGTDRIRLRVGDTHADLYVRPGSDLHVRLGPPPPDMPRSISGTTQATYELLEVEPLDINALTSDLNEKLDDFLMADLATDRAGGMQAVDVVRRGEGTVGTPERPPTLFVTPNLSSARVDTFEMQLRRFYRGIDDPWFERYLSYGVAGLRLGPRASERALFERHLKGRPIDTTVPEQVRFIRDLFTGLLDSYLLVRHEPATLRAMAMPTTDSLKALFARHDFLRESDELAELVMLDQLYIHHDHPRLSRKDVLRLIDQVATRSPYPAHRQIAANMLWDITTMRPGNRLPPVHLTDLRGRRVDIDSLLKGPACVFITASWCTWCDLELTGLAQLDRTYNGIPPITVISLDTALTDVVAHRARYKEYFANWLHAPAELQLREDLRLRTLPAVLLLNDGVLEWSPAPLPSDGLGAIFHRMRTEGLHQGRIKVWDD
jgi:hypothetical protein